MKFQIEINPDLLEEEVIIKAKKMDQRVQALQEYLSTLEEKSLAFYKGTSEFFLNLDDLLFFETDGSGVVAHTSDQVYEVKLKLYELESGLPYYFCRISKSTIVNCRQIFSLDKSFSGTSKASFYKSSKWTHVSRHYYPILKERLEETR